MLSKQLGSGEMRVVVVASNKGGVGKTTVATNLAIFLRALDEDLPILVLSFDDQGIVDRMFDVAGATADSSGARSTLDRGWAQGHFDQVIQTGQFGVDWIPSATDLSSLAAEAHDPGALRERLAKTQRGGLIIVDTKSDLGPLTRTALHAADCVVAPVADQASLLEVAKLLEVCPDPRRVRVLQTLVDRRTRISPSGPLLARALRDEINRRGWRRFEVEISRSPRVELLNSESDRPHSLLHEARGTSVHREFRTLAGELTRFLSQDTARPRATAPRADTEPRGEAPVRLGEKVDPASRDDPRALLSWFRSRWETP